MTEVGRNETVRLEDDPRIDTFDSHSAFGRVSVHHLEEGPPVGHDSRHDVHVQTAPAPFDRSNRDDVDRVQHELMVQLGGVVDDHCVRALARHRAAALDQVAAGDLDSWIEQSALAIELDTRSDCGVELVLDTELDHLVDQKVDPDGGWYVDLGYHHCALYGMERSASLDEPLYAVLAQRHLIGLSTRVALYYASHQMGREEYMSARAELAYSPRLGLHPGSVRIAQVLFGGEEDWRASVRARHLRRAT